MTKPRDKASAPDERTPQTFENGSQTPDTPPKARRRIDLSTLRDVRLEMANVYRMVDASEIESQDGSRRTYMLRQIADVITIADVERRLTELEERQANGGLLPAPYAGAAGQTAH